jgi:hypothetical protein
VRWRVFVAQQVSKLRNFFDCRRRSVFSARFDITPPVLTVCRFIIILADRTQAQKQFIIRQPVYLCSVFLTNRQNGVQCNEISNQCERAHVIRPTHPFNAHNKQCKKHCPTHIVVNEYFLFFIVILFVSVGVAPRSSSRRHSSSVKIFRLHNVCRVYVYGAICNCGWTSVFVHAHGSM